MKKINLYLAQRQLDSLRGISSELGLPVAEIIRRAVDDYVARTRWKENMEMGKEPEKVIITESRL